MEGHNFYQHGNSRDGVTFQNTTSFSDNATIVAVEPSTDPGEIDSSLKLACTYIVLIYSPIFLLVGVSGNTISMIIWLRRISISPGSTVLYLTVMCLVDSYVLVHGCIRNWVKAISPLLFNNTEFDLRVELGCSAPLFLFSFLSDLSVWLIILLCIERTIAAWLPWKVKRLCRLKNGGAVLLSVVVFLALINIHFFWTVAPASTPDRRKDGVCDSRKGALQEIILNYWYFIDFAVYGFFPLAVIILLNLLIIIRLHQTQRNVTRAQIILSPTSRFSYDDNSSEEKKTFGCTNVRTSSPNRGPSTAFSQTANKRSAKILRTIITMTISHFLFTMPILVYFITEKNCSKPWRAWCQLVETICISLQLANHATHFFIYSATSSLFMCDLLHLFPRLNILIKSPSVQTNRSQNRTRIQIGHKMDEMEAQKNIDISACNSVHCSEENNVQKAVLFKKLLRENNLEVVCESEMNLSKIADIST